MYDENEGNEEKSDDLSNKSNEGNIEKTASGIDDEVDSPILYDADYIKDVAKNIFGEDIMITQGDPEIDINDFDVFYKNHQYYWEQILNGWYYTCELENQSNAKFSKYYFFSQYGVLIDAKSTDKIQRVIEFAPDFEHFFLVTYDSTLKSLSIRYYDKELERIWEREFEDTESYCYDYTSQTVYTIVNNDLYSINIETGEDNIEPVFIGNKTYVRKLEDGLLSIDQTVSTDAIMKTDLNGEIIWKVTTTGKIDTVGSIQIVDENVVVSAKIIEDDSGAHKDHYYVIDNETGDVLQDVIALQEDEIADYIFKH